ncbi:hypothetical protein MKY15_20730 [Sporosarcina sp. FSL K6-1540]|uniref:hypothetical protein n=1 Tax=Sporosarcina sp. FSL K6-1540 TaxID=2921555 RepID=UPI00315A2AA5
MPELKEIYRLYYENGLSASQVAKSIDRSKTFVIERLHEMDGPRTIQEGTILRSSPEYSDSIRKTKLGEKNAQAKLSESDVLAIREQYLILQGTFTKTQAQYLLADDYGVKRPTISDIVLNKTWKHI